MQPTAALPEGIADFAASGVSVTLASRDERLVPSIAHGVACRVEPGSGRVTVFVFAQGAEALLRDVARCGRVAVTLSRPSTHRTLQFKGHDATLVPVRPTDLAAARRSLVLFSEDLVQFGWEPGFVESAYWHDSGELLAVSFTPDKAFQQTPGPDAGRPLGEGGTP